ncbi:RHS repeat protein [Paraburkholderia azotifigens]|uniref:RHS repeat protein n=1 Tax=Paraburkholderia azotifigens TaxID=2057004 RepID=A0A5C6V6N2_9BURK|nr:RHS repeat protein [Paraburkholderia azotifigens]
MCPPKLRARRGRNGTTLQWDAEGHLLSTLTNQHRATYRYDALGRRTAKRVEQISMPGLLPGPQARETRFVWRHTYLRV